MLVGKRGGPRPSRLRPWTAAFVKRLHELGWVEMNVSDPVGQGIVASLARPEAKALSLDSPPKLLALTDEVIE